MGINIFKTTSTIMPTMYDEIMEIPQRARELLLKGSRYPLPLNVPYLGMGSSYFAALAFKFMGIPVFPELASEYYLYIAKGKVYPLGVLLSQSGRSSEVLWCRDLFTHYIAICNDMVSPLCATANLKERVDIMAGEEVNSSSKTYINTLIALFLGFNIDVLPAIGLLETRMNEYDKQGKKLAEDLYGAYNSGNARGIYITGNGPNIATAYQAALIFSECTKLPVYGMPMAQYDHGPKETSRNTTVIQLVAHGPAYSRTMRLSQRIENAGAFVIQTGERDIDEQLSVINNIVPLTFAAFYLAQQLGHRETFTVGGKVTEVQGN